jgi:hypothetical protein
VGWTVIGPRPPSGSTKQWLSGGPTTGVPAGPLLEVQPGAERAAAASKAQTFGMEGNRGREHMGQGCTFRPRRESIAAGRELGKVSGVARGASGVIPGSVGLPPSTPLALVLFGLLLGLRHALEPDHLAAVSTLVAAGKRPASAAARLGAFWGLGHTLAITAFGGALLLLRTELPIRAQSLLELLVAAMLVVLGARGLHRAYLIGTQDGPVHEHGVGKVHRHGGDAGHVHLGPFVVGLRPILIGLIHGLAGTGAMVSLVMATLPTAPSALLMLASFGAGSLLGMAAVTFLAGASHARITSRSATGLVVSLTGLGSMSFGIYWGAQQLSHLG